MVLVLSKFKVANGMTPEVKEAFLNRPHQVEGAAGFIRLDVVSPCDQPDEIWLLTYWQTFPATNSGTKARRTINPTRASPGG